MENVKTAVDVVSVSTIFATVVGYLPEISALFALFYTVIRIYETKTVQGMLTKYRKK